MPSAPPRMKAMIGAMIRVRQQSVVARRRRLDVLSRERPYRKRSAWPLRIDERRKRRRSVWRWKVAVGRAFPRTAGRVGRRSSIVQRVERLASERRADASRTALIVAGAKAEVSARRWSVIAISNDESTRVGFGFNADDYRQIVRSTLICADRSRDRRHSRSSCGVQQTTSWLLAKNI